MKPAVLMRSVTAGVSRSHKISSGDKWNIKNNIDPVYVLVGDLSPTSETHMDVTPVENKRSNSLIRN